MEYCTKCNDELDKDCHGSPRCPTCDPPCPCCYDGGRPSATEAECTDDPGTGQVYFCQSLDCPVHGERNIDWATSRWVLVETSI